MLYGAGAYKAAYPDPNWTRWKPNPVSDDDTLNGGADEDTASYRDSGGVRADLTNSATNTGHTAGDSFADIENLEGSSGVDTLVGDGGANKLRGWGGGDTLTGGAGDDEIHGGPGADTLDGGADTDTASYRWAESGVSVDLNTGTGSRGDTQGDRLSNIENLVGSPHGDVLKGTSGANAIQGLGGDDTIDGLAGADTLRGGGNADSLYGGDDNDTLEGGAGAERRLNNEQETTRFRFGGKPHPRRDGGRYRSLGCKSNRAHARKGKGGPGVRRAHWDANANERHHEARHTKSSKAMTSQTSMLPAERKTANGPGGGLTERPELDNLGPAFGGVTLHAPISGTVHNVAVNTVGDRWIPLAPGMAATVEIATGKRRAIDFFLSPLRRYTDEALRER